MLLWKRDAALCAFSFSPLKVFFSKLPGSVKDLFFLGKENLKNENDPKAVLGSPYNAVEQESRCDTLGRAISHLHTSASLLL